MNRRCIVLATLLILVVPACGDGDAEPLFGSSGSSIVRPPPATSGALDPSGPGGTGTVPVSGPGDWLEWTPAESPDASSESELVAALEELDMVMIVPTSAPPGGGVVAATFNSMSLGRPTGMTFPGTTSISLNVGSNLAIVASPSSASCPDGAAQLTVRSDPGACAGIARGRAVVEWREAGHSFSAVFAEGVALDEALGWLETWRRLP